MTKKNGSTPPTYDRPRVGNHDATAGRLIDVMSEVAYIAEPRGEQRHARHDELVYMISQLAYAARAGATCPDVERMLDLWAPLKGDAATRAKQELLGLVKLADMPRVGAAVRYRLATVDARFAELDEEACEVALNQVAQDPKQVVNELGELASKCGALNSKRGDDKRTIALNKNKIGKEISKAKKSHEVKP